MKHDELVGLSLLFLSLLCLGTWPAILRSTRGNLCHVYIDYAIAYWLVCLLPLLLAQHDDLRLGFSLVFAASLGGVLLSLGNLSLQWAVSPTFGLPLTTTLAIQASMTVILGTSINFYFEPQMTPHPILLGAGVVAFLVAICLAMSTQMEYDFQKGQYTELELVDYGQTSSRHCDETNPENPSDSTLVASRQSKFSGLLVAVLGGLAFGFFSPLFNIAVNDPFGWSIHPQSVTVTNAWFSSAFVATSIVTNVSYLYWHSPSILSIWRSHHVHKLAYIAGIVCGLGNILQFLGGKRVGYATADLVQAYPIVSTVWDVVLFGEFRSIYCRLFFLLFGMYASYLTGIGLLAASSLQR